MKRRGIDIKKMLKDRNGKKRKRGKWKCRKKRKEDRTKDKMRKKLIKNMTVK